MLVHICCSVDSHFFLQELRKAFPLENLIGFFYNPNIHPKEEHDLRLKDVKRSCEMLDIKLIEGQYDTHNWRESVRGLESAPEKGERCNICFDVRLIESAKMAQNLSEKKFTTTLLSSPMKAQEILYTQGDTIAKQYNLEFIKINVRANGGVNRQNELAKKDNLYRQNYCGCEYALKQQRDKQGKISLEMLSSVNKQILPASNEQRKECFKKRDIIEKNNESYILRTQKSLVWRLLNAKVWHKKEVIPSYIIARSGAKKRAKSSNIVWIKPNITDFYMIFYPMLQGIDIKDRIKYLYDKELEFNGNDELKIGYSKRDDSVFMDINMINFLLDTSYTNVGDMMKSAPKYESELLVRCVLCGSESINPIIVLDSKIEFDLSIDIDMLMQEESVFMVTQTLGMNEYLYRVIN